MKRKVKICRTAEITEGKIIRRRRRICRPRRTTEKRTGVLNLYLTLGVSIAAALAALLSVNVFFRA